jgi:hypothetical protein
MANNIWLEVSKSNGAILSFFLEQPTTPSTTVDYVEATGEELLFLNTLEDAIFAPGMVATLSDLIEHRTRLQAAQKAKPAVPIKASPTAPQQPSKATKAAAVANFKNGFKPVRKQTQGN